MYEGIFGINILIAIGLLIYLISDMLLWQYSKHQGKQEFIKRFNIKLKDGETVVCYTEQPMFRSWYKKVPCTCYIHDKFGNTNFDRKHATEEFVLERWSI